MTYSSTSSFSDDGTRSTLASVRLHRHALLCLLRCRRLLHHLFPAALPSDFAHRMKEVRARAGPEAVLAFAGEVRPDLLHTVGETFRLEISPAPLIPLDRR